MNFLKISLLFFAFLISVISFGQKTSSFGISLGTNVSSFRSIESYNDPSTIPSSNRIFSLYRYENRIGFNVGFVYRKKIVKWFYIRPELNFMTKGVKQIFATSEYEIDLHYLNLPVIFQISPFSKFNIEFGLEPSYLIGLNHTLLKKQFFVDSFDLGGILGLSYMINEQYEISARYGHGFMPIQKINYTNDIGNEIGGRKEFNHYLKISASYFFNTIFNLPLKREAF